MTHSLRLLLFSCAFGINILPSMAQQHATANEWASLSDGVTLGETALPGNPVVYPTNETFTLATPASPRAGGIVTGAGIYTAGTAITFTAIPAEGYAFAGWSGDAVGTSNRITVTLNANKTVIANFQELASTYTHTTASTPIIDPYALDTNGADGQPRGILSARVYPNPAKETTTLTVTLDEHEAASVIVYDAQGHEVDRFTIPASGESTQRIPYNVVGKKAGIYQLVVVSTTGRRFATKLVVE